jgi:peptidyl-prolyl cis-trans isomerase SurA
VVARLGPAPRYLAVILAFAPGLWGWHPPHWRLAAQPKQQGIEVLVNDEAITAYDIDQRARFLGLSTSTNLNDKAKEVFKGIVKDQDAMRALQEEVVRANPGKSQEELVAIMRQRLGCRAFEGALTTVVPELHKDAKEELIDDRRKLQHARKHGIEVADDEVKSMLTGMADRYRMTYTQFQQHLMCRGVDIATVGERFRAEKAWRDLIERLRGAGNPGDIPR